MLSTNPPEHMWMLSVFADYVQLLNSLLALEADNENRKVTPEIKLKDHRLMKFFGVGTLQPISFRFPQLVKYVNMVDDQNYAFHGTYEDAEMEELLLTCSKPTNRVFLGRYGLQVSDVDCVVKKLKFFRVELPRKIILC